MPSWIAQLRRLAPEDRREALEERLRDALAERLAAEPAVARALASAGGDGATLAGYTFDEGEPGPDGHRLGFTYRLLASRGAVDVRGAGIAVLDDAGALRFEDVDADIVPPELDGDD